MCNLFVLSLTHFTTRTAVRNKDVDARTAAREQITADTRCAVLAGVVANSFLCLLTTNQTPPCQGPMYVCTHTIDVC